MRRQAELVEVGLFVHFAGIDRHPAMGGQNVTDLVLHYRFLISAAVQPVN
jgi:hypothetical protein